MRFICLGYGDPTIFGDLGQFAGFVDALQQALEQLDRDGVRVTVGAALDRSGRPRA